MAVPDSAQTLCDLVVERGLRRRDTEVVENGLLSEEVEHVVGVPFGMIPFKATKGKLFGNSSNPLFTRNRGIGTILNDI